MPKITFDDDLELEDAVEPLLPANIPEDAEVESSEPSSSDDEAAPEALDSRKQKSKLQGKVRSERLAQQECGPLLERSAKQN